jgi:hypothetical protein
LAIDDKNFKIKNGLDVLGATATVNGNDVLTTASSIDDLSDVETSGVEDGDALVYDSSLSSWIPGTASSVASLDDLTDVDVAGAETGNTLVYDTTTGLWTAAAPGVGALGLDDLNDVSTSGAADGDALVYDSDTDSWLPGLIESGAVYMSTTPPPSPSVGQLWFDETTGGTYVYYDDGTSEQWVAAVGGNYVINTDGLPGRKLYVGSVDPDDNYSLQLGDIWLRT